jgi:hypothetical protein
MTQDKKDDRRAGRDGEKTKKKGDAVSSSGVKAKEKTDGLPTKVAVRLSFN